MIEQLPSLTPDQTRSAQTAQRCRQMLDRRRADVQAAAHDALERNALLGFGAAYLSSLAFHLIRVLAYR